MESLIDRELGGHARVHDYHLCAHAPSEHVDGRAAAQEVEDHLGGNLLGIGADPLTNDAVVGGGHDYHLLADLRSGPPVDAGEADGELLETPETAGGLGQDGVAASRVGH